MRRAIPLRALQMFIREGILTKRINGWRRRLKTISRSPWTGLWQRRRRKPETIATTSLSGHRPTSSIFETRRFFSGYRSRGKKSPPKTMADLINATLRDEMRRDERIVIFG